MSIKGRVTRLEGQIKPIEAEPTPLTNEERAEAIRALLERAEADPSDYGLQQRAASILQTLIIAKGRAEGVNTYEIEMQAIAKWRAYFERIKRGGRAEGIYARMWTEAVEEIRRAAGGLQYEAGFTECLGHLMDTSPVEDVGAADTPADTPIDEPQFEDISPVEGLGATETPTGASQPKIDTLDDDAGATETPPIPEPLPIPDPPPIPKPSPEPVGIPPERRPKPLTIRGGLRPAGSATGPWR